MAGQRVKGGGGEVGSERESEGKTCQRVVKALHNLTATHRTELARLYLSTTRMLMQLPTIVYLRRSDTNHGKLACSDRSYNDKVITLSSALHLDVVHNAAFSATRPYQVGLLQMWRVLFRLLII